MLHVFLFWNTQKVYIDHIYSVVLTLSRITKDFCAWQVGLIMSSKFVDATLTAALSQAIHILVNGRKL